MKSGNTYSAKFLEEMDLVKYMKNRDKRILTLTLSLIGRSFENLGDDLPRAVLLTEMIYNASCHNIMPYSFSLNVILYKKLNSKFLSNIWGNLHGGGSYYIVLEWLKRYADDNPAKLSCLDDVVIGTDNEQKLGKSYVASIKSCLSTSVIAVVVAFFLNLRQFYQYIKSGCTSNWRFGEKEYLTKEKKNILAKALKGRDKGC